jgi:hypothetical protein
MKTTTIKSAIALAICLFMTLPFISAQVRTGTIIDVVGKRYGDTMWMVTYPGTTPAFDNGWDAKKMKGGTLAPSIYHIGPDGIYQINTMSDVHNQDIGFVAGEDSEYTITFTQLELNLFYNAYYLHDKVADTIVNIWDDQTKYTFTCSPGDPVNRFTILTSLPEVPKDDTPVVVVDEQKDKKDKKDKKEKVKKLKVYSHGKYIIIENPNKQKGKAKVINALTGKQVANITIQAESTTTVNTKLPGGTYVVPNDIDEATAKLIIE